jgi:hypothetical protein
MFFILQTGRNDRNFSPDLIVTLCDQNAAPRCPAALRPQPLPDDHSSQKAIGM